MYNCHIHTFTDYHVPDGFLPLGLVKMMRTKVGYALLSTVLKNINPFTSKDAMSRMANSVSTGRKKTQRDIFEYCKSYYPSGTIFNILTIDMEHMGAGKVVTPFDDQLKECSEIAKVDPTYIPFIHIDPRRANIEELFWKYVVEEKTFKGIKLYLPLGYYPFDIRLERIWKKANEMSLPVTSHCTYESPVHYKGDKDVLIDYMSYYYNSGYQTAVNPVTVEKKKLHSLCQEFTNPKHIEYMASTYKNCRYNIAHYGGAKQWDAWYDNQKDTSNLVNVINNLISTHDNIYTDVSFIMEDAKYYDLLNIFLMDNEKLSNRVLFGSDYYVVQTEADENQFGIKLKSFLGKDLWSKIAIENPKSFLL